MSRHRQEASQWVLQWSNWRGHHEWVGRLDLDRARSGEIRVRRKRLPKVNKENFDTEAEARERVAELEKKVPIDELAYCILPPRAPQPAAVQQSLAMAWPEHRRP